ncbi:MULTISPECIES: restriction endonuclease subunit S [Streptococcus]|jgi:restriction modification system DNA specificity domain protein|uniref:restriction endonuclease subunit S n=1 Tax=Streptococcus TaxID=1301 RepID=UPI00065FB7B9|nr:restriction endonuclease subunit S [Streptococcus sp. 400_SSPC]
MEYVKLGNIAKFRYGKMPDKDKFLDDGYPVFSGYRITGYYSEYMVENPTLIVVARGVGGTGDVKISPPKSYITNLSIIVDLDESVADIRYLYYQFVCNNLRYLDTGAAQSQITINNLSKHKALLPRLVIQKKISSILTTYDNLIENNNKRIKLLEQMAENLYKEWFVRFRFPGYEDVEFVGALPIGWQYQPISESMDFFDSQRVPLSAMQRDEMEKIYPYYGAAKLMDYVDDYLFDGEYLLLGEDGTVVTTDGFPVLQLVNDKFWVNNHAHVIRGKGNISTRFLYLTFCRFPITSVVTGSAQPKISKGRLEKLKILVPDAITMEHFNNLINPMFDEINVLKKQLIRITKQRDMLLPRLMSGKLEV